MTFSARILVFAGLALFLAGAAQAGNRAGDAAIYEQNGKALFESEQWAEAATQFAAAYTQGNDPAMLFNMALCYRRAGNNKRALGLYQRYLVESPPGPNRMVAQSRIQELQQELAAGERGARPTKDAAAYEQDGKSLYQNGRWADAAGAYKAAYTLGKDPGMLYNAALCYRRAGDAKRALDLYRQYLMEAPDTPKRANVESRIKELQQELALARLQWCSAATPRSTLKLMVAAPSTLAEAERVACLPPTSRAAAPPMSLSTTWAHRTMLSRFSIITSQSPACRSTTSPMRLSIRRRTWPWRLLANTTSRCTPTTERPTRSTTCKDSSWRS